MNKLLTLGLAFALPFTYVGHVSADSISVSGQPECVDNAWQVAWSADVAADPGYSIDWIDGIHATGHFAGSHTSTYSLDLNSATMQVFVNGMTGDSATVSQPDCPVARSAAPAAPVTPPTTTAPPNAVEIPGVNDPVTMANNAAAAQAPTDLQVQEAAAAATSPDSQTPVVVPVVTTAHGATTAPTDSTPASVSIESFPPSFMGWPAVVSSPPW